MRRGLLVAAIGGVVVAWAPVRFLAPALAATAFDASMVLLGLVMAGGAWARSRGSHLPDVWRVYALAGAAWALSNVIAGLYQIVEGHLAPVPSVADVAYLLFLAAVAGALARLHPGAHEWRDILDSAIVAVSLALLASFTAVGQLFSRGELPLTQGVLLAGYALVQIALVSMAFMATLKVPARARLPLVMLAAGLVFIALSKGAVLLLRLEGAAGRGAAEEVLRIIGIALLASVPLMPRTLHRAMVQEPGLPTVILPLLVALAGLTLVARDSLLRTSWTQFQGGIAAALLGLMLTRMTVTGYVDLRLRKERAAAIERLHEVEAQRTMMLRAISHEIQNPLTPVMLHAQMVAKQAPEAGPSLDVIQRNIKQVSRLAKDLNIIARSDAEEFDLNLVPADLLSLAQHVVDAEGPNAQERGIGLSLVPGTAAPVVVDPDRIIQVMGNMVRNALKFTPRGGRVTVHIRSRDSWARVEVTDTGRGLLPSEAAQLFRAFTQIHDRGAQSIDDRGSGLGLYIAKRLVESHRGSIGVSSPGLGRGSTFWFELPLDHGEAAVPK